MEAGAPEGFFCPISLKLFRDPVMLPTGQTCALPSPPHSTLLVSDPLPASPVSLPCLIP